MGDMTDEGAESTVLAEAQARLEARDGWRWLG